MKLEPCFECGSTRYAHLKTCSRYHPNDSKFDYYEFSAEAIQSSIEDVIAEARENGASDDLINAAMNLAAQKFMDTNFMKEPQTQESDQEEKT